MTLNFKANCCGFDAERHKLYLYSAGCRKPKKVEKY